MTRRPPAASLRQRGLAMIALITLLAMISSYFIANALNRTTSDVQIVRDRKTAQALQEAKAALIAWVASESFKVASTLTDTDGGTLADAQIGHLPCPDTNNDGMPDTCNTADTRIGRLPWQRIGASDLRDGSGERLWYALSANYRKAAGTTEINVDTPGSISLTGSLTTSDIVAVIIAPGGPLSGQNRSTANENAIAHYLEGANAGSNDEIFFSAAPRSRLSIGGVSTLVTPTESDCDTEANCLPFNDQLVFITRGELWQAAEAAVPTLLQNLASEGSLGSTGSCPASNGGYLEQYRCLWGRYPFPAAFSNPESSSYVGTVGASSGLLPVSNSTAGLSWKNPGTAPVTPTIQMALIPTNQGGTAGTITPSPVSCTRTATQIQCNLSNWSNRPTVRINNLYLNGAGRLFVGAVDASQITIGNNNCNKTVTAFATTQTLTPYQSGGSYDYGMVDISFRLPTRSPCTGTVNVRIVGVPSLLAITSDTDAVLGWVKRNQWQRHLMYAVAPGWLPDGNGSCTAGSNCLSASNLPTALQPANNKRVMLVYSGRALPAYAEVNPAFAAQSRHSSSLGDYFEGTNLSPENMIFNHNLAATRTANDRVVVMAP